MTNRRRVAGEPCWIELGGEADQQVLDFWAERLGWTFDANEDVTGYRRAWAGGEKIAGFGGPPHPCTPRGWRVYVHVENLPALVETAVRAGAELLRGETPAGRDGRFAFIRDPYDVVIGLFEPYDDPGTARPPGLGRVARWSVRVSAPGGFRAFHTALPYDLIGHVDVTAGNQGWQVSLEAREDEEAIDPAGNVLTLRRNPPSQQPAIPAI